MLCNIVFHRIARNAQRGGCKRQLPLAENRASHAGAGAETHFDEAVWKFACRGIMQRAHAVFWAVYGEVAIIRLLFHGF